MQVKLRTWPAPVTLLSGASAVAPLDRQYRSIYSCLRPYGSQRVGRHDIPEAQDGVRAPLFDIVVGCTVTVR